MTLPLYQAVAPAETAGKGFGGSAGNGMLAVVAVESSRSRLWGACGWRRDTDLNSADVNADVWALFGLASGLLERG
jgi:hypothetical protein